MKPDETLGEHFKKAEKELNEISKKYNFTLRLVDAISGTWYFFPEVECDFQPQEKGDSDGTIKK